MAIGANVTVQGRFNANHALEIVGANRKTSRIFGTPETGYNKKHDGCGACKSAILGSGNHTITVRQLTSENPYGFHFTGKSGSKLVIDSVDALDTRGGSGNNSDGVSAAAGTMVRNSYFSTGDDVIKVYADIEVTDTTIEMIDNTVPIQFGWGNYGSGARGVFRNLTITGTSGRFNDENALISARAGRYDKTLEIHGLVMQNRNGVIMAAQEGRGNATVHIDDAVIDVKKFVSSKLSMNATFEVCGKTYVNGVGAPARFRCLD